MGLRKAPPRGSPRREVSTRDRVLTMHKLRTFLTIAKTRNISRAAEILGVSQPTATLNLQRLEDFIGTVLFHRTHSAGGTYRMDLTPEGQALLPFAKRAVRWVDVFESAGKRLTEGESISTLRNYKVKEPEPQLPVNFKPPEQPEQPAAEVPDPGVLVSAAEKAITDLEEIAATGMLRTQLHVAVRTVIEDINTALENYTDESSNG